MDPLHGVGGRARAAALLFSLTACSPSPHPGPVHPAVTTDEPARRHSAADEGQVGEATLASRTPAPAVIQEPEPQPVQEPQPFQEPLPDAGLLARGSASRVANLSPGECRRLLEQAQLGVERFRGPAPGIALPLRITGPLGEVSFQVPSSKTPFGLLDCRLALILAELAPVFAEHGVVRIRIDNFYRPRARLPGRRRGKSQHAHGLAADVVEFGLADGTVLHVERDWQGERGAPPCGEEARLSEVTPQALRLRNLVCAIARGGYFHHILTPSYDAAHRDHLHLDIKRDEKWFSVR